MKEELQVKHYDEQWRYERKGVLRENHYRHFIELLKTNHLNFAASFPDRQINNIYFDRSNFTNFTDHIEGTKSRFKPRIRWYGTLTDVKNPKLEFKIKDGNVGNKLRYNINSFKLDSGLTEKSLFNLLKKSLSKYNVFEHIRSYHPVLLNSYVRSYFLSFDKKIRVTVDRELTFGRFSLNGNHGKTTSPIDPRCVVEIKFSSGTLAESFKLDGLSMNYLHKFSKYVEGVKHVYNLREL